MSSISFHKVAVAPTIVGMKNAHALIQKGYEHAKTNNIDPNDYLTARLHPDMADFRYQIYRFTDAVKFMPPRLNSALESISLPDEEQTFEQLLERIEKTVKYMESFKESDFEGKENEEVVIKFADGKSVIRLSAVEYVSKFAHANMWFHITTAYAILRMKGVDLGKFDFLNGAKIIEIEQVKAE
jgi:hypothetical protein